MLSYLPSKARTTKCQSQGAWHPPYHSLTSDWAAKLLQRCWTTRFVKIGINRCCLIQPLRSYGLLWRGCLQLSFAKQLFYIYSTTNSPDIYRCKSKDRIDRIFRRIYKLSTSYGAIVIAMNQLILCQKKSANLPIPGTQDQFLVGSFPCCFPITSYFPLP